MIRVLFVHTTDMKRMMKSLLRILCLALALPMLLSSAPTAGAPLDGRVTMTARLLEIGERLTVEVIESPYTSGIHIVHTPPETRLTDSDGAPLSRDALSVGDTLRISYSGQVMLSYPPQIVAARIVRLE